MEQNMLFELMLKAGAGYELAEGVEETGYCYFINGNELVICLKEINQAIIDQIIASKPQKTITLDNLFVGNDQLKTNTVLQMRDAGIDFKTI